MIRLGNIYGVARLGYKPNKLSLSFTSTHILRKHFSTIQPPAFNSVYVPPPFAPTTPTNTPPNLSTNTNNKEGNTKSDNGKEGEEVSMDEYTEYVLAPNFIEVIRVNIPNVRKDNTTKRWYTNVETYSAESPSLLPPELWKNEKNVLKAPPESPAAKILKAKHIGEPEPFTFSDPYPPLPRDTTLPYFGVKLDSTILKTPKGQPLVVPAEAIAKAIEKEWKDQDDGIVKRNRLWTTRIAIAALDIIPYNRGPLEEILANKLARDAACHWVTFNEEKLYDVQHKTYRPMLNWLGKRFGIVPEISQVLFQKFTQPPELIKRIREYLETIDDFHMAALCFLVDATRSIVIPLYLLHGKTTIMAAVEAARIEEDQEVANFEKRIDYEETDQCSEMMPAWNVWRWLPENIPIQREKK